MKKNKKAINKKIIIIMIILCIILLIVIPIVLHKYKRYRVLNSGKYKEVREVKDPKEDGILNLSGFGIFFEEYTGEIMSSDIAYKMEEIVTKKIPRTYDYIKDYDTDELYIFYQNNQRSIYNMYGIDNSDDFIKFGKTIQIGKDNLNDCYRLDVIEDSFNNESEKEGYAYAEFTSSYIDDSTIDFAVYIAKSSDITPQYIITAK